jgi:hypothetical protein
MHRYTKNVEDEICVLTGNNWNQWNSKKILKKNLEAIPGKHSIDSLQSTSTLETSHIIGKALQCET